MKKWAYLSLILPIFMTGCSSSPDVSDVRAYLINYWSGCGELVSVDNVKKTNGVPSQDGSYEVDFTYDVVFKHPISYFYYVGRYCDQREPAKALGNALSRLGPVEEGDRLQMTESIEMVKSENGWVVKNQQLRR